MENKKLWRMRPYTEINKKQKKHKQYTPLRDPKTTAKNKKKIHKYYK